ncbi:MAG TPA: hypothetical protein ENN61_02915 [Bacteroidaceae bacterium]|nr:hypothetical protein [Bacteroidaceae bacterium]
MLKIRIKEKLNREYGDELKVAAVYSSDRNKLFEFVGPGKQIFKKEDDYKPETDHTVIQFSYNDMEQPVMIISNNDDEEILSDRELLEIEHHDEDEGRDSDSISQVSEKQETEMEEPEEANEAVIPAIDMIDHQAVEENEPDPIVENENEALIKKFIGQDPGPIKANAETLLEGDISIDSIKENDHLITDTLAKIYIKQGLYAKAIYAYEKLSLKFPEKSAYFAAQIEKIKNITNS